MREHDSQPRYGDPQQPPPGAPPPKKKTHPAKIAALVSFGILGAVILLVIVSVAVAPDDPNDDAPGEQMAAVMCEDFVKERLKSPGSAKFADVFETEIKQLTDTAPWKFDVRAHVDSQNDFGAMKRNNYRCIISTKDNDKWTLEDLQLTEQ